MKDHGLSDPDACESRQYIEIWLSTKNIVTLNEGNDQVTITLDDFLTEIEQRCQDSLHNIFDEAKAREKGIFYRLADICRPDPYGSWIADLI